MESQEKLFTLALKNILRIPYKFRLMKGNKDLFFQHVWNIAETISDLRVFLDFWNIIRC